MPRKKKLVRNVKIPPRLALSRAPSKSGVTKYALSLIDIAK